MTNKMRAAAGTLKGKHVSELEECTGQKYFTLEEVAIYLGVSLEDAERACMTKPGVVEIDEDGVVVSEVLEQ
jgi:hypothetical protein